MRLNAVTTNIRKYQMRLIDNISNCACSNINDYVSIMFNQTSLS